MLIHIHMYINVISQVEFQKHAYNARRLFGKIAQSCKFKINIKIKMMRWTILIVNSYKALSFVKSLSFVKALSFVKTVSFLKTLSFVNDLSFVKTLSFVG